MGTNKHFVNREYLIPFSSLLFFFVLYGNPIQKMCLASGWALSTCHVRLD